MNIHHLELFYYVARHGGIMPAVRNIPYGIQQPAVSAQVIQLEEDLGVTLFKRRPFALTASGKELYDFIRPFFENVALAAEKLRGGASQHLRVAASEIVLRDHLPVVLGELRRKFPRFKLTLREAYYPQVVQWLQQQEIDASIGLIEAKPPPGIQSKPLFQMPLVLLAPAGSRLQAAEELWKRDRIEETLITIPRNELITQTFQAGLDRLKVDWFAGIEVTTVDMVQTYVVNGYGVGVTIAVPGTQWHPQVRALPLADFPLVTFGLLWQGRKTELVKTLFDQVETAARKLMRNEDPRMLLLNP